jgi:hypothetical protein
MSLVNADLYGELQNVLVWEVVVMKRVVVMETLIHTVAQDLTFYLVMHVQSSFYMSK